jgi:hypothetical protein
VFLSALLQRPTQMYPQEHARTVKITVMFAQMVIVALHVKQDSSGTQLVALALPAQRDVLHART